MSSVISAVEKRFDTLVEVIASNFLKRAELLDVAWCNRCQNRWGCTSVFDKLLEDAVNCWFVVISATMVTRSCSSSASRRLLIRAERGNERCTAVGNMAYMRNVD